MSGDPDSEKFTLLESDETNGEWLVKTVARAAVLIVLIAYLPDIITALIPVLK